MTGAVVEVSGSRAVIRPEGCGDCFGCVKGGCAGERLVTAENPGGLPLSPGLRVEVRSSGAALALQALGSLLPPVLGFIAGFGLSGLGSLSAPARAAAGIPGLFLGGLAVYAIRRRFPPGALPRIYRTLQAKTGLKGKA